MNTHGRDCSRITYRAAYDDSILDALGYAHDTEDTRRRRQVVAPGPVDSCRYLNLLAPAGVLEYRLEVRPREKASESVENLRRMLVGALPSPARGRGEIGGTLAHAGEGGSDNSLSLRGRGLG